jgi:ribosome-binding factor A
MLKISIVDYFCKMEETNRQKKIAGVLQNDLANVLQNMLRDTGQQGIIISVSKVNVTTDLSIAKVFVSVFPPDKASAIVTELNEVKPQVKHQIAQLTRHQLRKMPELSFYNDDSLEYIETIEQAVKGKEDPIADPELLPKRKKS